MASVADLMRNINLYIAGTQYAGKISSVTPPDLAINVEEYRGGGMDIPIPIDRGMEMMTSEIVLNAYDKELLGTWGVRVGASTEFTIKAALEAYDGDTTGVVITMRGRVTNISRAPFEGQGETPEMTLMLGLSYYKEQIGADVVVEIDALNFKRIVNGVDHLAEVRAAIQ